MGGQIYFYKAAFPPTAELLSFKAHNKKSSNAVINVYVNWFFVFTLELILCNELEAISRSLMERIYS